VSNIGHYKKFQFTSDIPYWYSNFSDINTIKGILRFKSDIKTDAFNGSKEALCLLVDLESILSKIKLNKDDVQLLNYYQSGFSNYDEEGKYWSDNEMIAMDLKLDKDLVKKRINRIVTMIYDYNQYLWSNTYCKIFKDWIKMSIKERNEVLKDNRMRQIKKKKGILPEAKIKLHQPIKEGFVYSRLSELEKIKKSLLNKKQQYELELIEKDDNYKKIVNYYVALCEDINDIKRSLNMPVRSKSKRKLRSDDKTVIIYPIEYLDKVEEYQDKIVLNTSDKIMAWQIRNIIEEELTERQKQIFEMYYFKDMKQQEISDKIGDTQGHIARDLKIIKEQIKNNI
jgi:RNA polymerase sigma factor (sigma-70 family)